MNSIYDIFPVKPFPTFENLSAESFDEIEDFVNKKYTELENVNFGKNYSVFFFFPENGFVYYFPALILASKTKFSECSWCIEYTVELFVSDKEFREKWKGFSLKQRQFIADWLESISDQFKDKEFVEILCVVVEILRGDERYWFS